MMDDAATAATPTTLGYDLQVSMAISCIIAWLVPHLYFEFLEFSEYRVALEKQLVVGPSTKRSKDAFRATLVGTILALSLIGVIYSLSAAVISYNTQGLDRRADAIVIGMGRIMSAVLFLFFSMEIPLWLEVLDEVPQNIHFYQRQVTCSISELRYRVCRSVLSQFFIMYFILLLYFCNAYILTIIRSTVVGLVCGIFVVFMIWLGRKSAWKRFKRKIAISGSILVSTGSALAFTFGMLYIAEIWFEGSDIFVGAFGLAAFFGWVWVCLLVNFSYYRFMRRQKRRQEKEAQTCNKEGGIVIIEGINENDGDLISNNEQPEDSNEVSETVELALKLPNRTRSTVTETSSKTNVTQEDDNDTNRSVAVTIEDLEEESSVWWCFRRKRRNSKVDQLIPPKPPPRSVVERLALFFKWTLWVATSAFHLYLLIVNVGATIQQNAVRAALPKTFEMLYPPDYNSGPMCAWDNASSNGTIQTFDSLEDVKAANFTVIHCGACGACSNWNDLSLQWTTRTFLADAAQKCTKKSLGGGGAKDVQRCNENEIGFTEACSHCWVEDQLCAKKNCVFIYLQSVIVNQVSNFNVELGDITSATCDEALCGPEFVPCSGATRRRMNIISDIPRPISQQCSVAQSNWTEIFNHP